jgi:hypothetical protein
VGKKFEKVVLGVVAIVVSYYTGNSALGKAIYAIGVSTLANVAISAFTKAQRRIAPPINVTVRGTVEYRRLVFGRRRVGGVLVFYGVSGTNNQYLWYVIAYAGHQSSAFGDFWLDERRIDHSVIPGGGGGAVTGWNSKLNIWKYLGTSSQSADTNLDSAFGAWTSNHKLLGTTYAVVRFERDDDLFPDGAPQSVSCLLDGMLTYDARLDSTNGGSGSHRYANPSTWAFSRDPVQHIRWYLTGGSVHNDTSTCLKMYGLRELDTRVDDAYTIAASNICAETLTGANQPPSGDQSRYLCDLEAHCGETRREILTALLASMAGTITYVHGKWRIYAGAYDSPSHTLTSDDLYGDLQIQDTVGHDVRYNAVAGIYFDAAQQYVQTTSIYRRDSGYETQDNSEFLPTEIQLDAVTDVYQAQRLAEIHLRKSRMMRTVNLVGALNLLKIAPHETLYYTHPRYSWTARIFRAKERNVEFGEEAGRITHTAQTEDPAVYADMLTADYTTGTSATDTFESDFPINALPTWLTLDPEILASDPAVFWLAGSKATLSTSGGVRGGIVTLVGDGSTPDPNFRPVRGAGRQAGAVGQSVAFTLRYRRTTALTATSSNPALSLNLARWTDASGGSTIGDGGGLIDLSGLTVNVWYEASMVCPIINTTNGYPFVECSVSLAATDGSGAATGTVEIDYCLAYVQNGIAGAAQFQDFTGTAYTLVGFDRYTTRRTTSSSAVTITLPNAIPDGWNIGDKTNVIRGGSGSVTFSTAGTLRSPGGSTITVTNGKAMVQLVGVGVWELSGNV